MSLLKYRIICSLGDVEVRSYRRSTWISTVVNTSSFDVATYIGFHRLFKYIQGENARGESSSALQNELKIFNLDPLSFFLHQVVYSRCTFLCFSHFICLFVICDHHILVGLKKNILMCEKTQIFEY